MKFDLQDLACLLAVAEQGSFTRASESLHITQPALSRKIRDLEERLGVSLLERTTRHVRLTKAGELMSRYAATVLSVCEEAERKVSRLSDRDPGTISIGYGSRAQFDFLLRVIGRVHELHPDYHINISHGAMLERLYLGKLDAALLMEGTVKGWKELDYVRLDDSGLSAFFPKDEYGPETREISLEALRGRAFVIPEPAVSGEGMPLTTLHEMIRGALLAAGIPQEAFHTGHGPEEFCSRILSERLVGVMPDSSSVINNHLIDSRPIRECRAGFGIALAWNRKETARPTIAALREAADFISKKV